MRVPALIEQLAFIHAVGLHLVSRLQRCVYTCLGVCRFRRRFRFISRHVFMQVVPRLAATRAALLPDKCRQVSLHVSEPAMPAL